MDEKQRLIKPGRPKLQVDNALIIHLSEVGYLGWSRGAEEYRKRTGQWISRDTFKRRYLDAKAASKSWINEFAEELARKINERWLSQ